MSRWAPSWLQGTVGIYYRKYTDKFPLIVASPDFSNFGMNFPDQRTSLRGISLAKSIAGVSVGAEITHRQNTALLATGTTTVGTEPIGDTWHALINATGYAGKTSLFDSMVWMGELTYSKLDKVRRNASNFNSKDFGCKEVAANLGCADDDAVGISLKVEPKWFQVMNNVDLSMPLFYTIGLKGNSPVFFGGNKGGGSFSAGVTADIAGEYLLTLAYNGAITKHRKGLNPATGLYSVLDAGGAPHWDRDNVSVTFKTSF